jgi:integrase
VRQIHAVISGALSAAVRWGWLPFNPAETARIPTRPRPQPRPPSPTEAARIVEEAWRQNDEWGLYIWLATVTGARRGELLALRWRHVDLENGVLTILHNYVRAGGEGYDKDTKSHQMRRLGLDQPTVDLLGARREACKGRPRSWWRPARAGPPGLLSRAGSPDTARPELHDSPL